MKPAQFGYDHLVKLLIIGDGGVGKSCLLLRYADNIFIQSHISTIGIDFKLKTIEMQGLKIKLQIWDTAGHERFRTITQTYYRSAMGVLLVFDVSNPESFDNIRHWMRQVNLYADPNVNKILIGNKSDIEDRKVSYETANNFAQQLGIRYIETSAKKGFNVEVSFERITLDIVNKLSIKNNIQQNSSKSNVKLQNSSNSEERKNCCF